MISSVLVTVLVTTWLCNFSVVGGADDDISIVGDEGSGEINNWSNDVQPLTSFNDTDDVDVLRSISKKTIAKRAAPTFYNGIIERKFFTTFSYLKPIIPATAVIAFNRPLQRGNNIPQTQYIALWSSIGQPPHWGVIGLGSQNKLDGWFIKNRRVYNLSSSDLQKTPVRLLQYVGSEFTNNFKFAWTKSIDADMTTVVSEKAPGLCSPRFAPAILQDQGYEYLGEADIDNRIMYYVEHNFVNVVQREVFTNNVYLLTKQQCQCSCPSTSYKK